MNRFKIRLPIRLPALVTQVALIILVALMAPAISGCGAGQVSQTATQEPAVNGNRVTFNNVALRDIRIQAAQRADFIEPGKTVELVLVAVNQSPDITDRLVGITSDIGTVTVSGDGRLPASGKVLHQECGGPSCNSRASGSNRRRINLSAQQSCHVAECRIPSRPR